MPYVYYNEIDTNAAAWLTELIAAGHLPDGFVDTRSIWDVAPEDLREFTQHHFFAGIGGWAYALQLAGWPVDRPVWTGSCPCQPFSAAGKGAGFADERHLWPAWHHLIRICCPNVIFGEQVEAAIDHGWVDLVQADMEGENYRCRFVGLPSASIGAPHIRQRLWFVADADSSRFWTRRTSETGDGQGQAREQPARLCVAGDMENSELPEETRFREHGGTRIRQQEAEGFTGSSGVRGWWGNADWLWCADQKYRPVEPGTFPLAHGVPARVGRLRGYGNAIVPQVAAEVITAFMAVE